jgi:prepilin-type N-terminal cleavage/methylation domain-containing protein
MRNRRNGFTLVETLVAVTIFSIVSVAAYQTYARVLDGVRILRLKAAATNLANEQFEIIRNLSYSNVGIISGLPAGTVPHVQTLTRDGVAFTVTTTIRNVDLPQDGTVGGSPNDTASADAKLVEVEVACNGCGLSAPIVYTTQVSPKNLENTGSTGALFVRVIDASGVPIPEADVTVINASTTPTITINDVTDATGMLQIVGVPPSTQSYKVIATKDGYSTDQTYAVSLGNPTPTKPNATVATGQVTNVTMAIDETADLSFQSTSIACSSVGSIDFTLAGSKTIGVGLPKYSSAKVTNASGGLSVLGLEWDSYGVTSTDSDYMLAGTNPIMPVALNPGGDLDVELVVQNKALPALHVAVVDPAGNPIESATVQVALPSGGGTRTSSTGRGSTVQTNWADGSGQDLVGDVDEYYSGSNVNVTATPGIIRLANSSGSRYQLSGTLESSTFDLGTSTQFNTITWLPVSQAASTQVRFQLASNAELTATSTWDFVGPNGSSGTYYTTASQNIASVHNGHRYFRYKAFLDTTNNRNTPTVADVVVAYTSECVPPGQVVFSSVTTGTATVTVSKSGYTTVVKNVTLTSGWQTTTITLAP